MAAPEDAAAVRGWLLGVARRVLANQRRSSRRSDALGVRVVNDVLCAGVPRQPLEHVLADEVDRLHDLLVTDLVRVHEAEQQIGACRLVRSAVLDHLVGIARDAAMRLAQVLERQLVLVLPTCSTACTTLSLTRLQCLPS